MNIEYLGQAGLKIKFKDLNILVDPYLSNSVEKLDNPDFIRKIPIPYNPTTLKNINFILITHDHIDHCDPLTLPLIYENNPKLKFVGPYSVRKKLMLWGIKEENIINPRNEFFSLGKDSEVRSVVAAHPKFEVAKDGFSSHIGYLFKFENLFIYSAGDTCVFDELIVELKDLPRVDIAILPVNEDNFFRRRMGIIGNMSIREAFGLADLLNFKNVVPVHWDMFEFNSTLPEEISSVYKGYKWNFKLFMDFSELLR